MWLYTTTDFTPDSQSYVVASFSLCTDSLALSHWKVFQRLHMVVSQLLIHWMNVLKQSLFLSYCLKCRRLKLGLHCVFYCSLCLPNLLRFLDSLRSTLHCCLLFLCLCTFLGPMTDEGGHCCFLQGGLLFWETATRGTGVKLLLELYSSMRGMSCLSYWLPSAVI